MTAGEQVQQLIQKHRDEFFFTGGVQDEYIASIENLLHVTLSESYKTFIKEYGYGGINGALILGVALDKTLICVEVTESLRGYGLPEQMVVVENVDEYVYCLDTSKMEMGECPIVTWNQGDGVGGVEFEDFNHFLLERFTDAIENL